MESGLCVLHTVRCKPDRKPIQQLGNFASMSVINFQICHQSFMTEEIMGQA